MKILRTAFCPFGGDSLNASQEVMDALPERLEGLQIEKLLLPVSFRSAPRIAIDAAERLRPDAIVCLGQAGGRDAVTPERAALNVMDAAQPDNDGFQPVDEPVVRGGPAAFFSTLPVKVMVEAIARSGVPARLSDSAGTYVCNCLMYALLHWTRTGGHDVPCGFLHLPYLEQQRRGGAPALQKDRAVCAVAAALRVLE